MKHGWNFKMVDGAGNVLHQSGKLEEDGKLELSAHQFIAPPMTKKGVWIRKHDLWNTRNKPFDHSIPAQESDIIHYQVTIPETSIPPYTITSRLRYRRFNRWYTEWVLGKEAPIYPIVDMSSDKVILGEDRKQEEAVVEDHKRFDHFGNGMLR